MFYTTIIQEPKSVEERWTPVHSDRFIKLDVNEDSRLDTFVESCQLKYKSECFFFEYLADDVEAISENQEVVVMNEVVYTMLLKCIACFTS